MLGRFRWPVVFAVLFGATGEVAEAAAVRFHYVPADSGATVTMKPTGLGERTRWFGMVREICNDPLRPNCVVNFHNPCTGRTVAIPIAFPDGTPTILHGPNRLTYDYGSYAIRVLFFPDGSVDVVYDSGFLRAAP
jgi:hypothetical protein